MQVGTGQVVNRKLRFWDTISPVAVCQPITVYLDETGFASIAEDSVDNGSADACAFIFDTDTTEFGCSDVFETNIVTLTVTDASGNWSSCQSEVTVLDTDFTRSGLPSNKLFTWMRPGLPPLQKIPLTMVLLMPVEFLLTILIRLSLAVRMFSKQTQ